LSAKKLFDFIAKIEQVSGFRIPLIISIFLLFLMRVFVHRANQTPNIGRAYPSETRPAEAIEISESVISETRRRPPKGEGNRLSANGGSHLPLFTGHRIDCPFSYSFVALKVTRKAQPGIASRSAVAAIEN
jgi:hypothetical protein